jgi:hypothetical protein
MDDPNKFDWLPPGTTEADIQRSRYESLQVRHEQWRVAMQRWNEKAKAAGCESIDEALDKFQALTRRPVPVTAESESKNP